MRAAGERFHGQVDKTDLLSSKAGFGITLRRKGRYAGAYELDPGGVEVEADVAARYLLGVLDNDVGDDADLADATEVTDVPPDAAGEGRG